MQFSRHYAHLHTNTHTEPQKLIRKVRSYFPVQISAEDSSKDSLQSHTHTHTHTILQDNVADRA